MRKAVGISLERELLLCSFKRHRVIVSFFKGKNQSKEQLLFKLERSANTGCRVYCGLGAPQPHWSVNQNSSTILGSVEVGLTKVQQDLTQHLGQTTRVISVNSVVFHPAFERVISFVTVRSFLGPLTGNYTPEMAAKLPSLKMSDLGCCL